MNEIKELWKPVKRRGATRVIISGFKRNIYFIDLIDFSSKQHKSIKKCWDHKRVLDSIRIVDTNMSLYVLMDIRNT